eukprot:4678580-Pleurochrysis_carterae.AAC.1
MSVWSVSHVTPFCALAGTVVGVSIWRAPEGDDIACGAQKSHVTGAQTWPLYRPRRTGSASQKVS